jgi:hypothetical protein
MQQRKMHAVERDARRVHQGDAGEKESRLMGRVLGRGRGFL